jgi:LPXTG-site transpeptidase (sortase) family protein
MLSRINSVLLGLIILVDGYIIAAPLIPKTWLWWQQHHTQTVHHLEAQLHTLSHDSTANTIKQDLLIIPAIALEAPLHEGANTYKELAKGVWYWPGGSSPDQGGNTVLVGHRFTYTNPRGVFYSLDKLRIGDEIGVIWRAKKYVYKVSETKVVPPTDTAIEASTNQPTLTLYTCTPLWWPKNRLVIIAHLENV